MRRSWLNREVIDDLYESDRPFIFAYWHADLVLGLRIGIEEMGRRPIAAITSKSRDGQLIGDLLARRGMTIVEGSSKRGGMEAFLKLAKHLRGGMNGSMAVDGPRGPRRKVKEGVIRLAQMTGHAILPCALGYRHSFSLSTWDRLRIPLPFSKGLIVCGEPIFVDRKLSPEELTQAARDLEETLIDIRKELPCDRD